MQTFDICLGLTQTIDMRFESQTDIFCPLTTHYTDIVCPIQFSQTRDIHAQYYLDISSPFISLYYLLDTNYTDVEALNRKRKQTRYLVQLLQRKHAFTQQK